MKPINRVIDILSFLTVCMLLVAAFPLGGYGQETPQAKSNHHSSSPLIEQMVGTWNVEARMWPSAQTEPINLPPAVAKRHLIGGGILQEVMTPVPGSEQKPFKRIAYFNYNAINQQYEYFSIDTRLPQMMVEKSYAPNIQSKLHEHGEIILFGGDFVAPKWGENKNVAFRYRLVIGEVEDNRQTVRLYLTPISRKDTEEFLAFEYIYTRKQ